MVNLDEYVSYVRIPEAGTRIYKEECCMCFDTPLSPGGLFIDLTSFLAFGKECVSWNQIKTGHPLYLRITRVAKPSSDERPLKKPTLLAIGVEGGYESKSAEYEDSFSIVVLPSNEETPYDPQGAIPDKIKSAVEKVLSSEGAEKTQQLAAWMADKKPVSRFAATLQQQDNGVVVPRSGWKCANCDQTENLWLNLTDGKMLCGRRNWDGSGGNNHALEHYDKWKYPLAVKLGTITADLSSADVYSYPEDDAVEDPNLAQHLAHFGIDFSSLHKTEQTTAERELEQNLTFDWSRTLEKGKELEPLFGPGFTGMANLGNSCYMASVLQVMFSTKFFQERYFHALPLASAFECAPEDPTMDLTAQLAKLAHGLLSGTFSQRPEKSEDEAGGEGQTEGQVGIQPRMFKALIGRGHPEFSTTRQQDALEFYQHFLDQVEQSHRQRPKQSPTQSFRFWVEERIQCGASGKVRYTWRTDNVLSLSIPLSAAVNKEALAAFERLRKDKEAAGEKITDDEKVRPRVPLQACLEAFQSSEEITGFYSSAINGVTTAIKSTRLASFPTYLVLHMRKFVVEDGWVPKKLDVLLDVPDELDLSSLRSKGGLQPSEEELPEEDASVNRGAGTDGAGGADAPGPGPEEENPEIVSQLVDMGFPRPRCVRAARNTGNSGVEAAMSWLLEHMEDADIDDPIPPTTMTVASSAPLDEGSIATLEAFGFSIMAAKNSLRATGGDVQRAADWIFTHPDEAEAMEVEQPTGAEQAGLTGVPSLGAPGSGTGTGGTTSISVRMEQEGLPDGPPKYQLLAFVSHMGASNHSGHYVAHIRKNGRWTLFNDSKVAASAPESVPTDMGYLYIYQRVQQE
eukprot:TRINITY_DN19281_c0_g1_i1.p1 TRINITY_DN19281_c0_g1~~TRINITY_DN19281_c0_g1_i1.p1  ORF type:complete len:853 (+),score=178.72 TRINITY_DN19281_c0_g1_i1:93-2651(+)